MTGSPTPIHSDHAGAPAAGIPTPVARLIGRYRRKKAGLRAGAWIGAAVTAGVALFVVSLVADRFIDMPTWLRIGLTGTTVGTPILLVLIGLVKWLGNESTEELAGQIDDATPGSRDLLRTSVNFTANSRPATGFMLSDMLDQAGALVAKSRPEKVLGWGNVPWAVAGLIVVVPAVVLVFKTPMMDSGLLLSRFCNPMANLPRPSIVKIAVDSNEFQTLQQGDDVTVRATIGAPTAAQIPENPRATLDLFSVGTEGKTGSIVMTPRPGNKFEAVLKNVSTPVVFTVACADGRSEKHYVMVQPRPSFVSLTALYTYPRYTQLASKTEPLSVRELKGVEGTRVRVDFETSIPVAQSKVVFPESQSGVHWDKTRTKGSFQVTIERDTSFNIQMTSETGTDNRNESPFRVKLLPDNPPTVSLLGVPDDLSLYRDDLLNLSYKGSDDFGISEVFIRYHQSVDPRPAKEYTLASVTGIHKEVAGDFSLALRDITNPDDTWVDIELVMIDSKGQEGVSPATRLQVISNTPDRQLAELIGYQKIFNQTLARSVTQLKAISGRLTILLDGMDDSTVLKDTRKGIFDDIARNLYEIRFPLVTEDGNYRLFAVSEYPYDLQRTSEDLFTRAALFNGYERLLPMADAISKESTPRQDLIKFKAMIDAQIPGANELQPMLDGLLTQTRLTYVDCLAAQYTSDAQTIGASGSKLSEEAVALQTEKQDLRIKSMVEQLNQIAPGDGQKPIRDAIAAITTASALPTNTRTAAILAAIGDLRKTIESGPILDGHANAATEAYLRKNSWPTLIGQAVAGGTSDGKWGQVSRAAAAWARLRRDDWILNHAELYLATAVDQAGIATMANPAGTDHLNATVAAANELLDWTRKEDLLDRVKLLQRKLSSLDIEVRTGRLNTHSPAYDIAWQAAREIYLSIANDANAGRFTQISPEVDAGLTSLESLRSAFSPWSGNEGMGAAGWKDARASAMQTLAKLRIALEPGVNEGRQKALALSGPMLGDIGKNLTAEKPRFDEENLEVKKAVTVAANSPPTANGTMVAGKLHGRMADAPRVAFARDLSGRFSGYAIAVAAVSDLRQAVWAEHPAKEGADDLAALSVVFEYLSHLEEDVYDKTYAQHLQQGYGVRPYPGYLEEINKYMLALDAPIDTLSSALNQLAAGQATKLMADDAFTAIPVRINKRQRHDAQVRSIAQELEFTSEIAGNPNDVSRASSLMPLSRSVETPTAYWDRIYLASRTVLDAATANLKPEGAKWGGVESADADAWATAATKINGFLPVGTDAGDDVKTLRQTLSDFAALKPRVLTTAVSKLDSSARSGVRDDLDEWRGRLEGALRAIETHLIIPTPKTRPRARFMLQRTDMEWTLGRILRSESLWNERINSAVRLAASTRAQLLFGPDGSDPVTLDDLAFDFAREGSVRRRSAAVSAQASRSLNIEDNGPDEKYLKMPKYLYEELRKTIKKPYPTQFKDTALEYTQDLVKDSR